VRPEAVIGAEALTGAAATGAAAVAPGAVIHTVTGPVDPSELGPTSMHEHVFSDLRLWAKTGPDGIPWTGPIGPEAQAHLRWNGLHTPENLRLADPDTAVEELRAVHAAGGRMLVDLTVTGMGRRVADLAAVSRASAVAISVGCGFYVEELHPPELAAMDVDAIAATMIAELRDGLDDTGIRPALIGEIGTSHPPTETEWRVVRGAGRAGAETGAAVNVHLSWRGTAGVAVVEALVAEGMPADRIILSHLDEVLDRGYHDACAATGCVLEFDTFGSEYLYSTASRARNPTDVERLAALEQLIDAGLGDRLILGCDIWTQGNLRRNGGCGYEHLFTRVMPALEWACGADAATVQAIMVDTPRRLLSRT
jgi:phosphotriesterase-related protein